MPPNGSVSTVATARISRRGAATAKTVRNESRMTTEIGTRRVVRPLVGNRNSPSVAHATVEAAVAWMIFAMSGTPA